MSFQQNHLPQFLLLNQITPLPVEIPQALHVHSNMTYHWRSLYQLHHMHQLTLPVEIPQYFHLNSTLTFHCRRLYHINLLLQVTPPGEIPPFFLYKTQPQCSRNPSKSLKWTFMLSLPDFIMHLKIHSSKWSH